MNVFICARRASGLMHSYHTLLPNCDNSGAHFAAKIRNPKRPVLVIRWPIAS